MDFQPTEDQLALRAGIRELLDRLPDTRRLLEISDGFDVGIWRELTRLGVFSLRLPEGHGGASLGMAEAALVFEELGRSLVPGPLVGTFLAAGAGIRVSGADEVGEYRVLRAGADVDSYGRAVAVGLVERTGEPLLVEHAEVLDLLLVMDDAGIWEVDLDRAVDGARRLSPLDPLTPVSAFAEAPVGELVAGAEVAARWRREGAVLTAALQAGIASRTTELAASYAKEREQFGRPIGAFQAVKHICADMFARAEPARIAVYAAAVALDDPDVAPGPGGLPAAVATAKLMADEAALANAKACVQVHGGMGFTWETGVHLFLKRAVVLATAFGTAADHEETLAATLTWKGH